MSARSNRPSLLLIAALIFALGSAGGFLASRYDAPVKPRPAAATDISPSASTAASAVTAGSSAPAARASEPTLARDVLEHLLTEARAEKDAVKREALLDRAAEGLPRGLYGELLKALGSPAPDTVEAEAQRAIVLRWAFDDPTGAAAWALQQEPGSLRHETLGAAARRWTDQSPEQVLTWAATLAPEEREWVLLSGGDRLAKADPASFAVWSQAMAPSRERERLTLEAAQTWAQKDPAGLIAALAEHPSAEYEEWRRTTLAGLVNQLAQIDGPTAAAIIAEKIPPGPLQDAAIPGVAASWSERDPVAAARWIDGISNANTRAAASANLVGNWLEKDSAAAEAWAHRLPAGPIADSTAERISQYLASRDPAAGLAWADQIRAGETREQALRFVLAEWLQAAPDAAREVLRRRPELASLAPH